MGHDHGTMPDHDARKPLLFYKLVVASIVQDDKLKIPGKVVKRIQQGLSVVVTLSVPDGRKWYVKLGNDGGKYWFGDGWVEFMKYYSVRVGYLLVFRYKGDSTFVLNIFNLSNAEIQYLPNAGGGSERVRQEMQCMASKVNQCGNGDTQKKLDCAQAKEEKLCLQTKVMESGNDGNGKLASAQVNEDRPCSVTNGKESGNDGTNKMSYLAPQGLASVASQSRQMSGIICGLLQSKLTDFPFEILSQIKNDLGGSEKVQLEKQCSVNENDQFGNASSSKRPGSEMIRQDKQRLVNKGKESRNDVTPKKSGSENIEVENLCSVTSHTESANDDTQKKTDLPPPGFGKSSHQTPGIGYVLSPHNDRGVEKETKTLGGAGSPSSFVLVKDVTPGYYRANIMSFKKKKQPSMRKAKNSQPANMRNDGSGFVADKVKLNSLGKEELTPEINLSKMVRNVPIDDDLTTASKSEGSVVSHMGATAEGDHKKIQDPDKLYSERQLPNKTMNTPPVSERNVHTSVKRKKEINTADLLSKTAQITVSVGQKVDVSTADVLNCISERTAKVQKKQKTIQLSAIFKPPINPYCMVPMRVSYVEKKAILNIPANFASKYLQETSGYVTLQNIEGKQWKVRLISSNGYSKLSQGWYQFATDNYLKEGDMCIFELLDSVNTLLKVSFIRSPKNPPRAEQEVLKL